MPVPTTEKVTNRLINEKSPYLLQHAYNPVNWFPWCDEAFSKAKAENKPVFLSIGYSTCHWCHVMAHESFEDEETAGLLNKYFVAIKVDKEERPDIDSTYMTVCQALTGNGGWPMSIFMTSDKKPFYAGTYFPKSSRMGMIGFKELLEAINDKWVKDKQEIIKSADDIISYIRTENVGGDMIESSLITDAVNQFKKSFDSKFGGFGNAPKFPTAHNLMFLLDYYRKNNDEGALNMVETSLRQMYRGGLFDHIGYGFSRYSTDKYFLVPHFEKMLYDNALLIMCYSKTYDATQDSLYLDIALKTAEYILREMTGPDGEFYCAQDADSEGVEGRYYVFKPEEIISILGIEEGKKFNEIYGITPTGNFEGSSIPNLLKSKHDNAEFKDDKAKLREYRKNRAALHLDDKILTSWNSLMIAALSELYCVSKNEKFLVAAKKADEFIAKNLIKDNKLYVSFREGKLGSKGLLDDYAFYSFALTALYGATLDKKYLKKAEFYTDCTIENFYDTHSGGFNFSGKENEQMIFKSKETYDGAIPSGNSVMAYNLVKLYQLTENDKYGESAEKQLKFMSSDAKNYPMGYSFFLLAMSRYFNQPMHVTVVLKNKCDKEKLIVGYSMNADISVIENATDKYPLLNDKTTYYICNNHSCLPPTNDMP